MDCLRIGLLLLACLASCQALQCYNCTNCGSGVPSQQYLGSCNGYCLYSRSTGDSGTRISRSCSDESVNGWNCEIIKTEDGKKTDKTCSATCRWDGCNSVYPATSTTTTTTTTKKSNGAGDVAASRLVVLAVGSLTALTFLKF